VIKLCTWMLVSLALHPTHNHGALGRLETVT
jgi:hypothetical protein